jgi:hypothetical protein
VFGWDDAGSGKKFRDCAKFSAPENFISLLELFSLRAAGWYGLFSKSMGDCECASPKLRL